MYVRIVGTKEDVQRVAEEYIRQNYVVSEIRQDKKIKMCGFSIILKA
ncbi:hypothetical protein [Caldanaerobacter subterraneus]|nr:hypothetical protein [Caldanaerobacter subterraneus]